MNPKIRALIWEELRTGGVIAAWCTMVGGLCLLSARLTDGWSNLDWNYSSPVALSLSVLPLMLLALLLLYRTGNSGILTGGFSGRILLLPVETWKLAGLALFLRAALLGVATLIIIALCRALYGGNGPAWVLVLLLPAFFTLLQALDWLRRPNPLLALLGVVPVLLAAASIFLSESFEGSGLDTPFLSLRAGLGALILAAAIAFVFALFAVNRSRRGARLRVALRVALPDAVPIPGWRIEGGFRSPRWALLWHFLSKDGFLLPFYAVVFGAFVALGFGIWRHFDDDAVSLLVVLDWGVWPIFALAAMIWGGLRGGAGIQRGIRPVLTEYLYPMSAAEMAVTRLWGYGIVLVGTWAIAFILSNLGFFLGEHALAWRIWMGSLEAGESSLRELIGSRLFLPLVILIEAWVLTVIRTRLVAWMIGLIVLYATTNAVGHAYFDPGDRDPLLLIPLSLTIAGTVALIVWSIRGCKKSPWIAACWVLPYGLAFYLGAVKENFENNLSWLPAVFIVVITLAALVWSWQRGVMPLRHLAGCAVAWGATMLFAFPFGGWELSGIDRQSLFFVTMLGALVVLPYPALLLDLHRRRHHDDTPVAPEDHAHPRGWGLSPALRSTGLVLLVLAVLIAAWLRWPAKPVYIETLRAQGKPATIADLAKYYGPLPENENAALHYLKAVKDKQLTYATWYAWVQEQRNNTTEEDWEFLFGRNKQLADGIANIRPDQPLWSRNWERAQKYHEMVSGPRADSIESVAAMKLPRSHYPIDLGSGNSVGLAHLSYLRDLARAQSFEIWFAAMEDRPEDALKAIEDLGPFAESLREEPILISQLVRIAIYGIMTSAVEQTLNRTGFSEPQLAELQDFLSTVLPPYSEHSMISEGILGERVFSTNFALEHGVNRAELLTQKWLQSFSRITMVHCFAAMEKNTTMLETPLMTELAKSHNPQFALPKILLPALDSSREAEYRCRATLDMAATACAVERYRLANGALPTSLDALVPAFLEKAPVDPYRDDGGPVSYRVTEDGGYALYSWAQNRRDDGGINRDPKEKWSNDWSSGDWIFSVAPLSFRNGPQLTDTPPVEEKEEPHVSRRRNASK